MLSPHDMFLQLMYIPGFLKTGLLINMPGSRTDWQFNGPCYLKSKISPHKEILAYMSFHFIESSVLKVTKVKLSSLVWKIRHFKGQF